MGSGFVGGATGKYLHKMGHNVIFYDIDLSAVEAIKDQGYTATTDISDLKDSKYIFVCVPSPTDDNGVQILDYIISAIRAISETLKGSPEEYVMVVKSTILPGTTENVIAPILYKELNHDKIGLIYSPEFLTEIHGTWADERFKVTPENEHRLVIGEGKNKKWGDMFLRELYQDVDVPVIRTDYATAEMIKYASNNALAARISYWNEVFLVCQELGIDSKVVANAASLDPRIGVYGTVHGKAFGGKCLPKDLKAFINFAKEYHDVPLHEAIEEVNEYMKKKYGVRE